MDSCTPGSIPHSCPEAFPRHKNDYRRSVNSFWGLNICLLRIYKNLNFSLGAFRDLGLEILEKPKKIFLEVWNPQKWIPHTQKPIPRHLKIQNPSNGSKVIYPQSFGKIHNFLEFWCPITFEPFDGFWIFKCLGIGFWVWGIHFWGFHTSRKIFYCFSRISRIRSRKAPNEKFQFL